MTPLLILRPEPGAATTAARAAALGLEAIVAPLFTIGPVAWHPPDPSRFDALLLTSANAVRHAGPGLDRYRDLPVFAVGAATATAAQAAGLAAVTAGDGDATALTALAAAAGVRQPLHLAGREHRATGGATSVVVYAANPVSALPPPAAAALAAGAVALVHSPRAGRLLAALAAEVPRAGARIAAISPAAAEAAGGGWRTVATAARPTDKALLAVAARLCDDEGR